MSRRTVGLLLIGLGMLALAWMVLGGLFGSVSRLVALPQRTVVVHEAGESLRFESPPWVGERIVPGEGLGRELERRLEEIERLEILPRPELRWNSPRVQWNFSLPVLWPYIGSLLRGVLNLVAIVLILVGVGLLLWRRSQPAEKNPKES